MTTCPNPSLLQRQASAPDTSVWVDASAGTGKTKVLTDRVLRLLLAQTPPSKILCLTFTKAAAAEMQHRIMGNLSLWSTCSQKDLHHKLTDLLGHRPSPLEVTSARRLFFALIDDPYGLKVQTIHGFCQKLLRRFPKEAGLDHTASVLTDHQQDELLTQTTQSFLSNLSQNPEHSHWFTQLSTRYKPSYLVETLKASLQNPRLKRFHHTHDLDHFKAVLEEVFESPLTTSLDDVFQTYPWDPDTRLTIAQALQNGSKTDQDKAKRLVHICKVGFTKETYEDYQSLFLKKDGEPRKNFATQKIINAHPHIDLFFHKECESLIRFSRTVQNKQGQHLSYGLGVLTSGLFQRYESIKSLQKSLDYDDLIAKSAHLLSLHQGVSWVLYKLDGGLDHILVDEAQDTSPDQWQIILKIAEDFFTGESARSVNRTLFVVGDQKQSIYGFQGAEPDLFQHLRHFFENKIKAAKQKWSSVSLAQSFRSSPSIMTMVETVFEDLSLGVQGQHLSFHKDRQGHVELWPLYTQTNQETDNAYTLSNSAQLAQDIAQDIKERLSSPRGNYLGRPYQPSDFMILVQRRNAFLFQMIRALKKQGVPVAGPDRFRLLDHLVTHDLLALGAFVSFPQDTYSLACLLKSPFFNLTDDDLMTLRLDTNASLMQRLQYLYPSIYDTLTSWIHIAKTKSAHDFYNHVLKADQGWDLIRSRFGSDADDVVEEILTAAQDFDYTTGQSLQEFVEFIKQTNHEVKRDFSGSSLNAVRIMTVHGAKGLQAPVVYLPDTVRIPKERDMITWTPYGDERLPLWRGSPTSPSQQDDRDLKEYYRLLYVALTRAESELIIAGFETQNEPSSQCWYHCLRRAFEHLGAVRSSHGRFSYGEPLKQNSVTPIHHNNIEKPDPLATPLPTWVTTHPPIEIGETDPLSPSSFIQNHIERGVHHSQSIQNTVDPRQRGVLIHTYLDHLLRAPQNQWDAIATHLDPVYKTNNKAFMIAKTFLLDAQFTYLREGQYHCELPVIGTVNVAPLLGKTKPEMTKFSGQIDHVRLEGSTVIISDFKTGDTVPTSHKDCPQTYRAQLYIYGQLAKTIFPNKTIQHDLIWVQPRKKLSFTEDQIRFL